MFPETQNTLLSVESQYETVKDPRLRDFLRQFEAHMPEIFPGNSLSFPGEDLTSIYQTVGLQSYDIYSLYNITRERQLILFDIRKPWSKRPRYNITPDMMRAFAAICWWAKTWWCDTRWIRVKPLLSAPIAEDIMDALGQHPLREIFEKAKTEKRGLWEKLPDFSAMERTALRQWGSLELKNLLPKVPESSERVNFEKIPFCVAQLVMFLRAADYALAKQPAWFDSNLIWYNPTLEKVPSSRLREGIKISLKLMRKSPEDDNLWSLSKATVIRLKEKANKIKR